MSDISPRMMFQSCGISSILVLRISQPKRVTRGSFLTAHSAFPFFSAPSFAQEWIEYKNQIDAFGVAVPGQPNVKNTTETTEYGHVLPGRVYMREAGPNRYTVTVIDYTNLRQMETERIIKCRASGGDGDTCMDTYLHDVRGAVINATWNLIKRGGKIKHLAYSRMDLVEGQELYLINADGSQTFAGVYMHENHLFILEGTVPGNSPPPVQFYQSLEFLDKDGKEIRYVTPYANGLTTPARTR